MKEQFEGIPIIDREDLAILENWREERAEYTILGGPHAGMWRAVCVPLNLEIEEDYKVLVSMVKSQTKGTEPRQCFVMRYDESMHELWVAKRDIVVTEREEI